MYYEICENFTDNEMTIRELTQLIFIEIFNMFYIIQMNL